MKKTIIFLSLIISTSLFAQEEINLKCKSLDNPHSKVKTFTIVGANLHEQAGAWLNNLDARQYDPSYTKDGKTLISLNNGCDNSFDITFRAKLLKAIFAKRISSIKGHMEYGWSAEGQMRETAIVCTISPKVIR